MQGGKRRGNSKIILLLVIVAVAAAAFLFLKKPGPDGTGKTTQPTPEPTKAVAVVEGTDPAKALPVTLSSDMAIVGRVSDVTDIRDAVVALMSLDVVQEEAKADKEDLADVQGFLKALPVKRLAFGVLPEGEIAYVALQLDDAAKESLKKMAAGEKVSFDGLEVRVGDKRTDAGDLTIFEGWLGGEAVSTAIALGVKDDLLLLGAKSGDVAAMFDAANGKAEAVALPADANVLTWGIGWALKNMDPDVVKNAQIPADLRFNLTFGKQNDTWVYDVRFAPLMIKEEDKALVNRIKPADLPQVGAGDSIMEFASSINWELLLKQVANATGETPESIKTQAMGMVSMVQITEDELKELLSGSLRIVLGSKAIMKDPTGEREIPGGFIALQGKGTAAEAVAKKAIDAAAMFQLPLQKMDATNGWNVVAGIKEPVSVTLAAKGDTLVLGVFDVATLGQAPVRSKNIEEMVTSEPFGYMAFDVASFVKAFEKLEKDPMIGMLIAQGTAQNPGVLEKAKQVLAVLQAFSIEGLDFDHSRLSIKGSN